MFIEERAVQSRRHPHVNAELLSDPRRGNAVAKVETHLMQAGGHAAALRCGNLPTFHVPFVVTSPLLLPTTRPRRHAPKLLVSVMVVLTTLCRTPLY